MNKTLTIEIRGAKSQEEAAHIKAVVSGALALPNSQQPHLEVWIVERDESSQHKDNFDY